MRSFIFMGIVMPVSAKTCALLDLDFGAGLLELCLDRVGLVLRDALLDRLRSRVDEVLRLLEAEAGDRADDLDHLDLLVADAGEDDVERRLLLGRGTRAVAARARRGRDCDRSGGRDAPLLLDLVLELHELEHGHLPEPLEDLVDSAGCCHPYSSSLGASAASASEASLSSFSFVPASAAASGSGAAASSAAPVGSSAAASGSSSAAGAGASAAPSPPSCSIRASIRPCRFCSGAVTRPMIAFSGPMIAPSTWPRSTSSGGSVASLVTSSSVIARPSMTPPRIVRIFVAFETSFRIL